MNAQQLRDAAERIKKQTINYPFPMYEFAEYILATVHDDDDEPWDAEWLASIPGCFLFGGDPVLVCEFFTNDTPRGVIVQLRQDGRVFVNGGEVPCKTRGYVRRLLAALGVKHE